MVKRLVIALGECNFFGALGMLRTAQHSGEAPTVRGAGPCELPASGAQVVGGGHQSCLLAMFFWPGNPRTPRNSSPAFCPCPAPLSPRLTWSS